MGIPGDTNKYKEHLDYKANCSAKSLIPSCDILENLLFKIFESGSEMVGLRMIIVHEKIVYLYRIFFKILSLSPALT